MKTKMTVEEAVYEDSLIINFDQYDSESNEPSHYGGYVRITKSDDAQCFVVIIIDSNGDVLSETTVPYNFLPFEEF